jgi:C-terminal processing protease CtpA/Prc
MRRHVHRSLIIVSILAGAASAGGLEAQRRPERQDYERAHQMLRMMVRDLREHYYDSTFRGADLAARARAYDARIDSLPSVPQMMAHLAQFISDLDDSHTLFIPPELAGRIDYGFQPLMIGDSCYIARVREGSDAHAKGLRVGDRLLAIDGIRPTRQNIATIGYVYYSLSPRPGVRLVVEDPEGNRRDLDIRARVVRRHNIRDLTSIEGVRRYFDELEAEEGEARRQDEGWTHRTISLGDTVMVWHMRSFCCGAGIVDHLMGRAREHRALILDLRGNGGGQEIMDLRLIGHLFDRPIAVATTLERAKRDTLVARPARREPFRGMLVILINSESASASEVVARVTQLEERAIIVGDRSSGATMRSRCYSHEVGGTERVLRWALCITESDLILPDGGRLEGSGVIPTEHVVPTQADLAAGRDVQMARALELVGVRRTPEEAEQLFPGRRRR